MFNLPYTSAGVTASAVGMDKRLAKAVCRAYGYPVVEDIFIRETDWAADTEPLLHRAESMGYPLFVKPIHLGSSIGVNRANDRESLRRAIEDAFRYDPHLLVEKAVQPLTEINCSVIGTPEQAEASVMRATRRQRRAPEFRRQVSIRRSWQRDGFGGPPHSRPDFGIHIGIHPLDGCGYFQSLGLFRCGPIGLPDELGDRCGVLQ